MNESVSKSPRGVAISNTKSHKQLNQYGRGFHADQYERFQHIKPKTDLSVLSLPDNDKNILSLPGNVVSNDKNIIIENV
tara:strand:+ start:134 stop:370 length:237 start_codon:yes stop_codon:yes gene_type:complete